MAIVVRLEARISDKSLLLGRASFKLSYQLCHLRLRVWLVLLRYFTLERSAAQQIGVVKRLRLLLISKLRAEAHGGAC